MNTANGNFPSGVNSAHCARTMMLADLEKLFAHVTDPRASKADYRNAIEEDNCLLKKSVKTRQLSLRHLAALYGLDPDLPIFQGLRYFWQKDAQARPLLALICACARDPLLRSTAPFVLTQPQGSTLSAKSMMDFIAKANPDRFSLSTLTSAAQNINSTWTQSGHLQGKISKTRSRPVVTAASAAYALYVGWLAGGRGLNLFQGDFMALLSCGQEGGLELAAQAARLGWIKLKRIGDLVDVHFPNLPIQDESQ